MALTPHPVSPRGFKTGPSAGKLNGISLLDGSAANHQFTDLQAPTGPKSLRFLPIPLSQFGNGGLFPFGDLPEGISFSDRVGAIPSVAGIEFLTFPGSFAALLTFRLTRGTGILQSSDSQFLADSEAV